MRWDKFIEGATSGYGTGYARGRQFQDDEKQRNIDTAIEDVGGILGEESTNEGVLPIYETIGKQVDTGQRTTPGYTDTEAAVSMADGSGLQPVTIPKFEDPEAVQTGTRKMTNKVTGPRNRADVDRLKQALRKKLTLEGNTEKLMSLNDDMDTYLHKNITRNLEQAARVVGSNPEAAAEFLYNAYGYYPDDRGVQFRIEDGKLVGYGFNETTNKFTKAMELDSKSILGLAEQIGNPQEFKRRVAAENLSAAKVKYEAFQDQLKMALEERKVSATERGVGIDADRAEYQNLLDWATAVDRYFGSDFAGSVAGGGGDIKDMAKVRTELNGAIGYFDKAIENGKLAPAYQRMLGTDQGEIGTGYHAVQGSMADILTNNLKYGGDARLLSDADVMRGALDARMMEQFAQRELAGADWRGDEDLLDAYEDLMSRQQGVRLGDRGTLELTMDGQTLHLTPQKYPSLYQQAQQERQRVEDPEGFAAAQAAQQEQAQQTQQAGQPFADPMLSPQVTHGERLGQMGSAVVDTVSRNVVEPIANWARGVNARKVNFEWSKNKQISQESLDSLIELTTTELRQLELPDEVIQLVQRAQDNQRGRRGSGTSALGGTGRGEAIPGV